jgi:hypothetical protein
VAGLLLSVSTANAAKPLDVDCDLLAATNDAVNDFLDAESIQFDNLGDLVSSSILDDDLFDQLSALLLFFSAGQIDFTSASQAVSTNAKCGLIPQRVDNIRDCCSVVDLPPSESRTWRSPTEVGVRSNATHGCRSPRVC